MSTANEESVRALEVRRPTDPILHLGEAAFGLDPVAIEKVEQAAIYQERLLKVAIRAIPKHSWIDFGGNPYIEGGGALRALHLFGIHLESKTWQRHSAATGDYIEARADLVNASGRKVGELLGTRPLEGYVEGEHDAVHAAFANGASHAIRDLLGLGGMSWEDLAPYGVAQAGQAVQFKSGSKGGKAVQTDASGAATVPFGRKLGTPVHELTDQDLTWYQGAAEKSIADPSKAKYRAKEQAWLDAVLGEMERRRQPQGPPPSGPHGPDGERDPGADG